MASAGQPLTGADHFHLLIDRQMRQKGLPGNISRIHLRLAPSADLMALAEMLEQNPTLNRVAHLRLHHRWPALPKWIGTSADSPDIFIHRDLPEEMFQSKVLNGPVGATTVPVRIDLCAWNDGSKHLVVSMHHALFDHRGMTLFLQSLATGQSDGQLFIRSQRRPWRSEAMDALHGMFSALGSAGWNLATLAPKHLRPTEAALHREISFSIEDSGRMDLAAQQHGAGPGRSAFYMAVVLVALRELLESRGERPPYFWFPVPHNMRRKGANGHLIGNELAFLFFKIGREALFTVPQAVAAIQMQLNTQIRKGSLGHQAALQRVFRRVPFWMMNAMVGLTTGGRVSSLAFSDLGEERNPLQEFLGVPVQGMAHIPPVPCPPGLSVVFKREAGQLRLIVAYLPQALADEECATLMGRIRVLLLTPRTTKGEQPLKLTSSRSGC
ncbi:MAG: hypothetical protein K9J06_00555 [Flavobacteriales bacterium]|nr:hypothetical protein [Flavobacteriales bacterium]